MEDTKIFLTTLRAESLRLSNEIKKHTDLKTHIDELLKVYENGNSTNEKQPSKISQIPMFKPREIKNGTTMKFIQAMRTVFDDEPLKWFTPAEITEKMENFIKEGKVISKAASITINTHSALKDLREQGYVIKSATGSVSYRKANKD